MNASSQDRHYLILKNHAISLSLSLALRFRQIYYDNVINHTTPVDLLQHSCVKKTRISFATFTFQLLFSRYLQLLLLMLSAKTGLVTQRMHFNVAKHHSHVTCHGRPVISYRIKHLFAVYGFTQNQVPLAASRKAIINAREKIVVLKCIKCELQHRDYFI